MALSENKTGTLEIKSELHSTHLHTQPDDTSSPKNPESPLSEPGNGVTNNPVQDSVQQDSLQQPNNNGTTKLHGITNDVEPDQEATQQPVVHEDELLNEATNTMFTQNIQVAEQHETDTVGVNGIMKNSTQTPNNSSKLKGVMTAENRQVAVQHETDTVVNDVTKNSTQTPNIDVSNAEQNEPETLPDLVLNENSAVNEANTTEDEDEAAEALLQLSKLDILPEEDTELPLGVLPVDAAPVLITLGSQDILNMIENFKENNVETGISSNNDDPKTPGDMNRTTLKRKIRIKIIQNLNLLLNHHHGLPLPKVTW